MSAPPSGRRVGRRERDLAVSRVLRRVLAANLLVAAGKLVVGALIGSLALMADGVHSFLDASSNVVGLLGAAISTRPCILAFC